MSKLALIFSFSTLTACAAGSTLGLDRQTAPRSGVHLELAGTNGAASEFPAALDPAVPSVDRIGREVRGTLGDHAVAQLDLCVSPSGRVTKLALAESSSFDEFDAALLRDAQSWRFAAMPGPDTIQICQRARVTYLPY